LQARAAAAISAALNEHTIPLRSMGRDTDAAGRRNASRFHFKDLQSFWRSRATGLSAS